MINEKETVAVPVDLLHLAISLLKCDGGSWCADQLKELLPPPLTNEELIEQYDNACCDGHTDKASMLWQEIKKRLMAQDESKK